MQQCTDMNGYPVACPPWLDAPPQQSELTLLLHNPLAIIIYAAAAVLCIKLAKSKGYGTLAGVIVGLCLPVIGAIFYALVPAKTPRAEVDPSS